MSKTNKLTKNSVFYLLFSLSLIWQNNIVALGQTHQLVPKNKPKVDRMKDFQKITSAPSFPDLPTYTIKTKFLDGFYLPTKNGSSVCQMRYSSEEEPKNILEFYKQALPSNGWKIEFAAGPSISARHNDGHLVTINVTESKLGRIKSNFVIAYRQLTK